MVKETDQSLDALFNKSIQECEAFKDLVAIELGSLLIDTNRKRLAFLFLATALDHFRAIIHLLDDGRYVNSAFALVRPLMDATFRSLWISHLATDDQVAEFESNAKAKYPSPKKVCELLNSKFGQESDELIATISKVWERLSGYVHTGLAQLSRLSEKGGKNFPHKRAVMMLVRCSTFISFSAGLFATSIPNLGVARKIDRAYDLLCEKIDPELGASAVSGSWVN